MSSHSLDLANLTCAAFADELAARVPVPGGGAASAYVGALAAALASMVGNFTVGKPRYADVEKDVRAMLARAARLRDELMRLAADDARAYGLVSDAYALPKEDPVRPAAIEDALHEAALPPYRTVVACARTIALLEEMGQKGSRMLLSDVACGAHIARAAMESASVSVYVNTSSMADRDRAAELDAECDALLSEYVPRAQAVASSISSSIRRDS